MNKYFFCTLTIFFIIIPVLQSNELPGTILEKNLLWQKCNIGENPEDCSGEPKKFNWKSAKESCEKLTLLGKKWRLPEIDELSTLVLCKDSKKPKFRESCGKSNNDTVSADINKFPTLQKFFYWSNTVKQGDSFYYLFVDFENGFSNYNPNTLKMYVKCVSSK